MAAFDWVTAAIALSVINALLLGSAGFVWLSNYRQFRTTLLLGLVTFATVMLVENVMMVYSFFRWGTLYADSMFAKQFFTGLRGAQFLAFAALNYATWR